MHHSKFEITSSQSLPNNHTTFNNLPSTHLLVTGHWSCAREVFKGTILFQGLVKKNVQNPETFINKQTMEGHMEFTAIIRKGEKMYVALCPEVDVVSQGKTIEDALKNLKEAVELYIEEMGIPKEVHATETIIARFAANAEVA